MASQLRIRLVAARIVVALVVLAPALVTLAGTTGLAESGPVLYEPPVDSPVTQPFQAPSHPYGRGNRGLKYDPPAGTSVRAAADGTVTFAGPVGSTRHVTVLHRDGLRTTYSFLDEVLVRRGMRVTQGDAVGTAGPGFHFGARDGDTYIDPALLFGDVEVRVRLIPHTSAVDIGLVAERRAIEMLKRSGGGGPFGNLGGLGRGLMRAGGAVLDWGSTALDWGRTGLDWGLTAFDWATFTLGALLPLGDMLTANIDVAVDQFLTTFWPIPFLYRMATEEWNRECTGSSTPVAVPSGHDRVAVTVAGFGSTSRPSSSIDNLRVDELGYDEDDVIRFSYRGGRIPDGDVAPDLVGIAEREYDSGDTFKDLRPAGEHLADLIEAAARARPGVPVDVYAHSQGGVVTRLALQELEARGSLGNLGVVVTIGTPNRGTDMATVAQTMGPVDHMVFGVVSEVFNMGVPSTATSVAQMAETSGLIRELRRNGVPDGVDFRTIGLREDLVVPADRTKVSGQPWAIVHGTSHGALPGASTTTRELQLAMAGLPPGCRSVLDTALDNLTPMGVRSLHNFGATVFHLIPG